MTKTILTKTLLLSLILLAFTFVGCSKQPALELDTQTTDDNIATEDTDEPITSLSSAPYILVDFGVNYEDPYPLEIIDDYGINQLYIEDQSASGDDNLDMFVMNLKDAVAGKKTDVLLSLISDDVEYSIGMENSKADFIKRWGLDTAPDESELWPMLENILIFGGKLIYADEYQIPYMYSDLGSDNFDAVATGFAINMRASDDVNSDIVGQINYNLLQTLEISENTYTIDGINYNWVKIKKEDGSTGYMVNTFLYSLNDYRITISHANGYWEIISIVNGN